MPISNGQYSFSTGRDVSLILIDNAFGRINLPNVTGFNRQAADVPGQDPAAGWHPPPRGIAERLGGLVRSGARQLWSG